MGSGNRLGYCAQGFEHGAVVLEAGCPMYDDDMFFTVPFAHESGSLDRCALFGLLRLQVGQIVICYQGIQKLFGVLSQAAKLQFLQAIGDAAPKVVCVNDGRLEPKHLFKLCSEVLKAETLRALI